MITPRLCGSSSKTNVWKKSSVLCRKKLVKNVFILFCLFEHIFNQSLRFASSTKSCLRGPELGFNRPIFAMIFLHRIVIRTPKMVREDTVVPLVITSHMSDWINSASWAAFLVSALALRPEFRILLILLQAHISEISKLCNNLATKNQAHNAEMAALNKRFEMDYDALTHPVFIRLLVKVMPKEDRFSRLTKVCSF